MYLPFAPAIVSIQTFKGHFFFKHLNATLLLWRIPTDLIGGVVYRRLIFIKGKVP